MVVECEGILHRRSCCILGELWTWSNFFSSVCFNSEVCWGLNLSEGFIQFNCILLPTVFQICLKLIIKLLQPLEVHNFQVTYICWDFIHIILNRKRAYLSSKPLYWQVIWKRIFPNVMVIIMGTGCMLVQCSQMVERNSF